jgi:hypothetical protein
MSGLAAQLNAVNLGQGYPDYSMSPELEALVTQAMKNDYNQYVPMQGYMPLRESLAEKVEFLYGTSVNPDTQITVTPGGTYAIYTALTTVLQPGDEVIVFQPCYDSYIPNIEINGAIPVLVNLKFPEYRIDWNEVRSKINSKTRMIMLNTPIYMRNIRIKNPYCSNIFNIGWALSGRNVPRILLPSSGGNGSRLKTKREILRNKRFPTNIAIGLVERPRKSAGVNPCVINILAITSPSITRMRFARTPAIDTITLASL